MSLFLARINSNEMITNWFVCRSTKTTTATAFQFIGPTSIRWRFEWRVSLQRVDSDQSTDSSTTAEIR